MALPGLGRDTKRAAVNLRSCHTRLETEFVPPPVSRYHHLLWGYQGADGTNRRRGSGKVPRNFEHRNFEAHMLRERRFIHGRCSLHISWYYFIPHVDRVHTTSYMHTYILVLHTYAASYSLRLSFIPRRLFTLWLISSSYHRWDRFQSFIL